MRSDVWVWWELLRVKCSTVGFLCGMILYPAGRPSAALYITALNSTAALHKLTVAGYSWLAQLSGLTSTRLPTFVLSEVAQKRSEDVHDPVWNVLVFFVSTCVFKNILFCFLAFEFFYFFMSWSFVALTVSPIRHSKCRKLALVSVTNVGKSLAIFC